MPKKIFLIAGEASGDALGAKLMTALEEEHGQDIEFYGVGGDRMEQHEFKSVFPMHELSLLGFVEIIPHIPHLLNRIDQVVEEIQTVKPDIVVTIDAPMFNFRIAKKLQEQNITLVHYVAPTVWAYKPRRAEKISKLYDHLLLLLPFEPPYFEEVGLDCTFVGHPIIEEDIKGGSGGMFSKHGFSSNDPVLCMMPGSRSGEIKRLLPVFKDTVTLLEKKFNKLKVIILATKRFHEEIEIEVRDWAVKTVVVSDRKSKKNAFAAANVALAKSGTGTLEFAIAKVPMVVAYKVNPISAWILKRMIKVRFVNLINIILGKEAIPEKLQEECTAEDLAIELETLLNNEEAKNKQLKRVQEALDLMGQNQDELPSNKAAKTILSLAS